MSFGNSCAVAGLGLLEECGRNPCARPLPLGSMADLWKGRQEVGFGGRAKQWEHDKNQRARIKQLKEGLHFK